VAPPDDFLPAARLEFRAFYTTATEGDAVLMDTLLTTQGALTLFIKEPRSPGESAPGPCGGGH
jgi:hypothetical protein